MKTHPTMNDPKSQLRRSMLAKRRSIPADVALDQHRALVERLAQILPDGATVGTYAAFGAEISVDGLYAARTDLKLAWPRVNIATGQMEFAFADSVPDATGAFGIREPAMEETVPPDAFDVMLTPGVAFSPKGARLGMGKGFYDRFLANLRDDAVTLGVCYDLQLTHDIPEEAHDVRMDGVVTNRQLLSCGSGIEALFGR